MTVSIHYSYLDALRQFYEKFGWGIEEIVEKESVRVKGWTPYLDAQFLGKNHIILDNGYVTQLSHSVEYRTRFGIDAVCDELRVPGTFKTLHVLFLRDTRDFRGYQPLLLDAFFTVYPQCAIHHAMIGTRLFPY